MTKTFTRNAHPVLALMLGGVMMSVSPSLFAAEKVSAKSDSAKAVSARTAQKANATSSPPPSSTAARKMAGNAVERVTSATASKPVSPAQSRPHTLAEAASQQAGSTDVIASVDTPQVTNIVDWKEKVSAIPKSVLEFTALEETMQPTDRDRLVSEIRYTQLLNQSVPAGKKVP